MYLRHVSCRESGRNENSITKNQLLEEELNMLWTIFVVLLVLWLLGLVGHVGGGLIHLLLLVAGIVFLIQVLSGRRPAV